MEYMVRKALRMLYWNRWISLLMAAEMTLGMSIFVYSANLLYSLKTEEKRLQEQERDMVLEISVRDGGQEQAEPALTLEDYGKLQTLTEGKTFLYIAVPQFFVIAENNYEFSLVLADYEQLGLEEGYSYWGKDLKEAMYAGINLIPELQNRQTPDYLNQKIWKTQTNEITLKDCAVGPITYMEQIPDEISSGFIHVEWDSAELSDAEGIAEQVETYLKAEHGEQYNYRVYLPELDLKNNSYKVKNSIQVLNKAGVLMLMVFLTGMFSIFQLLFERRREGYGVCQACGAEQKQILMEIFIEIALVNFVGTVLGNVIGWTATYYLDVGIMTGYIKVHGSLRTVLLGLALCFIMTSGVTGIIYTKLARTKIIKLLRN